MIVPMSRDTTPSRSRSRSRSKPRITAASAGVADPEVDAAGPGYSGLRHQHSEQGPFRKRRSRVKLLLSAPANRDEIGTEQLVFSHSAISKRITGSRAEVAAALRQLADHVSGTLGAPIHGAHVVLQLFEAPVELEDEPKQE
jgi:hypothetical protein